MEGTLKLVSFQPPAMGWDTFHKSKVGHKGWLENSK